MKCQQLSYLLQEFPIKVNNSILKHSMRDKLVQRYKKKEQSNAPTTDSVDMLWFSFVVCFRHARSFGQLSCRLLKFDKLSIFDLFNLWWKLLHGSAFSGTISRGSGYYLYTFFFFILDVFVLHTILVSTLVASLNWQVDFWHIRIEVKTLKQAHIFWNSF